jgi:hypothetical protein
MMVESGLVDDEIGSLRFDKVSSSWSILPKYRTRRYEGAGGRSSCQSAGHEFHASSFTRAILVPGSKANMRRFPEMSKKVTYVCAV